MHESSLNKSEQSPSTKLAARITELEAEVERLHHELETANNNHRVMARNLAETGIRRDHAESQLERVRAETWQPIETAPKDGTRVLAYTWHDADDYCAESFGVIQIIYWDGGNSHIDPMWNRLPDWHQEKIGIPIHWMPLPASPLQKTEGV